MNRIVLAVCLCLLSLTGFLASGQVKTPASSPSATTSQKVGLSEIKIDYSRPNMNGRDIFGGLIPYGKLWMTSPDDATEFTFSDDATVAGNGIEAGKYTLFTIPGIKEWRIILYKDSEFKEHLTKKLNEELVAVSFKIKPIYRELSEETFTIYMNNIKNESFDVLLLWENTLITFPISFETSKKVELSIQETLTNGGTADDHYQAAKYYLETGQNLTTAHKWISKAVEMSESAFWMYSVKCEIETQLGKKQMAKETEKKFLELSHQARLFEESLPKSVQ